MNLKVFNSITKKLEDFVPLDGNKVKIYICGPTVYDSPHIGHARTYISFDIIRRILSDYFKYDLTFVMNITNIDDKIIKRAKDFNMSCFELSNKFEKEFFEDMESLKVQRPDFVTRVTDYITEIIDFIKVLESNNFVYESNGSVYFNLKKYKEQFNYNILRPYSSRDEEENIEKTHKEDFALWKASKDDEISYPSPWGNGRPGWHIECSVMASSILGSDLDIHAGGIDLSFPHHENEMAQCQGYFKKEWVKYFLHTGHLNINGLKMSKSLKNFLTIKEILKQHSPLCLRVLFLQHSWNKQMNYEPSQLIEAESLLKKILNFISTSESIIKKKLMNQYNKVSDDSFIKQEENCAPNDLRFIKKDENNDFSTKSCFAGSENDYNQDQKGALSDSELLKNTNDKNLNGELNINSKFKNLDLNNKNFCNSTGSLKEIDNFFLKYLNNVKNDVDLAFKNNFDTPKVFNLILDLISETNKEIKNLHFEVLRFILNFVLKITKIFGLENSRKENESDKIAELLNDFRSKIKINIKNKNGTSKFYEICDEVRKSLKEFGYTIDDLKDGSVLRKSID